MRCGAPFVPSSVKDRACGSMMRRKAMAVLPRGVKTRVFKEVQTGR